MGCNKAYYLNLDNHPLGSIINIAIGKIASTEVNVDEALQTGKDQIEHFKLGDPKHSTAIFPDEWKHTKRSSQLKTLLWLIRKLSMLGWLGYLSAIGPWTSMPYWPVNCLHIHHWCLILQGNLHLRNPFKLKYQRQPSSKMPQSLRVSCALGHRLAC